MVAAAGSAAGVAATVGSGVGTGAGVVVVVVVVVTGAGRDRRQAPGAATSEPGTMPSLASSAAASALGGDIVSHRARGVAVGRACR